MRKMVTSFAFTLGFCSAVSSSPTYAEQVAFVSYSKDFVAGDNCAIALRDSAARLGIASLKVVLGDDEQLKALPQPPQIRIDLLQRIAGWGYDVEERALSLTFMPFVFRDPAHFNAFIGSDLYRDMRKADESGGHPWLAVAFGGYYQLFSVAHAMTEPSHFYDRFIGGANHAQLFRSFHAIPSVASINNFGGDVKVMEDTGERMMAAVEEPLLEAFQLRLDKIAKFVNLDFSAANPVVFTLGGAANYSATTRRRVTAWAEGAAATCSATNFAAEQKTLDDLKRAGLTVVPVNRDAFVEAGWLYAMTRASHWTARDFDRLVQLGNGPKPRVLPSALVRKLPPKERNQFLASVKTEEKRRADAAGHDALNADLMAVWAPGAEELANALEQIELLPPKPAAPTEKQYLRPMVSRAKAIEVLQEIDRRNAADDMHCDYNGCATVVEKWCDAARSLWQEGDRGAAGRIFAFATRFANRPDIAIKWPLSPSFMEENLPVWVARIAVKDPAVSADMAKVAASITIPDDATKSDFVVGASMRLDRVRYIASLGILLNRVGNHKAAELAFARASDFANELGSSAIASLSRAYMADGNIRAARALAVQSMEGIEPSALRDLIGSLGFMDPLAGNAARLLEALSDREFNKAITAIT